MANSKRLRLRGVRRKQVDEDKIALAYLLLAKQILADEDEPEPGADGDVVDDEEAA